MNQTLTDIGYWQEDAQRGSIMSSSREGAKARRDIEEIARIVVDTAFSIRQKEPGNLCPLLYRVKIRT